jgi:CheY-like chemotaxis protein
MTTSPEPVFRRYHHLMPHRVREVLLVSSRYDYFILEEDGPLTERIFDEYSELSLSSAPRVTHVRTGEAAIEIMKERRFDLVLVMMSLSDLNVVQFGRQVKKLRPGKPVVLLTFDNPEAIRLSNRISPDVIDQTFMWNGDSKILLAIIKYIEDSENVDHDIEMGVRVILVVEDSIRYYSSFLGQLYSELMTQSSSLYSEGVNRLQKLMHMRARPKILHARTYERAVELFERYSDNLLTIISDVDYLRGGRIQPESGLEFIAKVRKTDSELPVLLHSSNQTYREKADDLCAKFIDKNSPSVLGELRDFLIHNLGFGEFVFRMPSGKEVGRARDVRELEERIKEIPPASLRFHAGSNHISIWLMARSEFKLAQQLKPRQVGEFPNIEKMRTFLVETLRDARRKKRRGVIADFRPSRFEPETPVIRIGDGSIGGKARGIAFANTLIEPEELEQKYPGMITQIPQTIVIATDVFDKFMFENDLRDMAYETEDDDAIMEAFLASRLPKGFEDELRFLLERMDYPLAVRSSSLLEDAQFQPFAGIYATYMIPNESPDIQVRLEELSAAIKLVYASTYFQNARAYIENTARRIEEEKMAVVVQGLVGQRYGDRFYPTFSGVAQSHNFYPLGHQKTQDGVATLALGLGRTVVDGGQALRVCLEYPQSLPQYASAEAMAKQSQPAFWALDMSKDFVDLDFSSENSNVRCDLKCAEEDGTLQMIGSVYDPVDDVIRDGLDQPGPRVVSFANILKYKAIPLAPALLDLLQVFREGMACDIEIEFACDMGDFGRQLPPGKEPKAPTLSILQLRPISASVGFEQIETSTVPFERMICRSESALGHGFIEGIRDIVYVKWETFNPAETKKIAREVGKMNKKLAALEKPYVLIGPGRWGSSDPWLGIPVQWAQISGARVMVEASPSGFNVDPSQGTHFFQNITSLRIGYLTVPSGALADQDAQFVRWQWLNDQPACGETDFLRHVCTEKPFPVSIDGRTGIGVIEMPSDNGDRSS